MTRPVEHQSYCRICVAACGITVTVEEDRVTKVRGDATHPVSHGYVCSKGRGIPAWHHSDQRLDRPRVHGIDVDWDDALGDLARALQEIIDGAGPDAVGIYIATGMAYDTAGTAISGGWLRTIRSRSLYSAMTVDNAPVMVASELVTGHASMNPVFSPDIPGLLVLVGHNPVVSHGYGTALPDPVTYLRRFRAGGGTMWVLDPRHTESAALADAHLPIRPGGDVAVLAALARELLADGADAHELAHHCDPAQVDALRAALDRFTLERAAVAADVELSLLERLLADIRAHPGQLNLIAGTGVQMSGDGILVAWLRWVLLILNGSLDKADGMHFHDGLMPHGRPASPDAKVRPGPPSRPDVPRVVHQVPMVALVDEIEAGNLRALIVCGGNPISACPEPERMRAALRQLDVLVVIDVNDAEIAQLATHALPATGQLERSDISMFSQVSVESRVQFTPAVVAPVADRKPVWWILGRLAQRLGGDVLGGADPDAMTDAEFLRTMLAASPIDADDVFANGPHGTEVPVEVGWIRESFLRDGRWQLAPSVMLERLAAHEPPGPGLLLAPRREMGWSNSVRYDRHKDEPVVRMHPLDIDAAGVHADERCVLASAHGSVEVVVVADERVRRGVVSMTHGHEVSPGSLTSRIVDVDPLTAMPACVRRRRDHRTGAPVNDDSARARVERTVSGGALDEHPALQRYVTCFLETFLVDGQLDPRLRELVILRTAWLCEQPFEWGSHYRIAHRLDVSDDDVLATRIGPAAPRFGPTEHALLTAADEIVELGRITEETYARCRLVLDDSETLALELLHLAAGYRMMATILSTSRPSLAGAGLALWPPDGIGPAASPTG